MYDVIIVGGSFAGLATAQALRGRRVLLIDQRPIGSHQTSTCATPLPVAAAVGAAPAALEQHDTIVLHTGGDRILFPTRQPYITFDYAAFCRAMLAGTDAEVRQARVTALDGTSATTRDGVVAARFVVDASGWGGLRQATPGPARALPALGYGVETELAGRAPAGPGLHFYYERPRIRSGYAWVFGCGARFRIGVCAFTPGVALGPVLAAHLARFGLTAGRTHGGVLAFRPAPALAADRFEVGDAAGQCLPLTGEGIRTAIASGRACGRLLAAVLDGRLPAATARARHAAYRAAAAGQQRALLRTQAVLAAAPDPLRAVAGYVAALPPLRRGMLAWYDGGLEAAPLSSTGEPAAVAA